ncbi:MAG: hypothetical protein IKP66_07585 [Lachnospiraceae bacterium]|nr:hypothetical protein [Lachnospiraceae bacterium]
MRKLVFIIITIIFLIIGVISLRIINNNIKKHNIQVQLEKDIEESRKLKDIDDGSIWTTKGETLKLLSKHNVEWEKILVPEELKKEYMQKYPNGLFGDDDYDECIIEDYLKYEAGQYFEPNDFVFYTIKGKRKNKYKIHVGDEQFCHIYKIEKIELFDNNGDYVWKGYPMNEDNWVSNIQKIALQDDEEVGKSEDFYERYPNFTGILNPYHYKEPHTHIEWVEANFDNKELYCNVYYALLSEDYKLQIIYEIDEQNYLKDYKVNILEKSEHYFNNDNFVDPNSSSVTLRLIYRDRDWSKLPLSNNFKKRFSSKYGIFTDFQVIRYSGINLQKGIGNKHALELTLSDGSKKYVGLIYKIIDNKLDDIEIKYLPNSDYSKYTKEEVYNMF